MSKKEQLPIAYAVYGGIKDAYANLFYHNDDIRNINNRFGFPKINSDENKDNSEIKNNFESLRRSDLLTSSSLFMDIDKDFRIITNAADEEFIETIKTEVTEALSDALKGKNKYVRRSMMAKVLATMPVFFDSQDEIKEYFVSALSGCGDNSELKACENIVNDIMLQI